MKKMLNVAMLLVLLASQFNAPLATHAQEPGPSTTSGVTDTSMPSVPDSDTPTTESPTATAPVIPTETALATAQPSVTAPATEPPSETPVASATPSATQTITETQAATASPTTTAIQLSLTPTPDFITPGGTATLHWTIQGIDPAAHLLLLQMILPTSVTPKAGEGTLDPTTQTLSVPASTATGQFHLSLAISSDTVSFTVNLVESAQILASSQVTIVPQEQFTLGTQGGTIAARNGRLKIMFPAGALSENTQITVGLPSQADLPNGSQGGHAFALKAHGLQSNADIHQFSQPVEIQAYYADFGIQPGQENFVRVWWYNPDTQDWAVLPSGADPVTGIVDAVTDHFSTFDVSLDNWQASTMPRIDDFQVSGFTGAATYSLPIQVPEGPGGLKPSLALSYNSQIVDQSTTSTQPDWVGLGWNLDTGSITLDEHGTGLDADESWLLNTDSISTRIIKTGNGTYRSLNESFWKITRDTVDDSWTVYDKTGNVYYFGTIARTYGGECDVVPYMWSLTTVTNIFGQQLTYAYANEFKDVTSRFWNSYQQAWVNCTASMPTAQYPTTITYP